MLNSQFLDGGPVFSIFQKSNMEVVQASLNSSLRAWQLLLGSMAGCWLLAQIMNQRQHRQPLHVSHGSNREGIVCTCPCLCLTSSKIIPSCSPCHGSLSICLRGCCWRRGVPCLGCVLSFSKPHPCSYKALPSICHSDVQLLLLVLQKDKDACSSPFRFPLLIEISCLPENNYCHWQLLQLKCLLMVCNAQAKLGITCQVMNEFN